MLAEERQNHFGNPLEVRHCHGIDRRAAAQRWGRLRKHRVERPVSDVVCLIEHPLRQLLLQRIQLPVRHALTPWTDLADRDAVRGACEAVMANTEPVPFGRLRITYTGGRSPLASDRGDAPPTLMIAHAPTPRRPDTTAVITVPWTRNERSATAGLKTTSYAENVVALAHAKARGATEALLMNTAGLLCEGTGSNVFVVHDGVLVTPPLASGALAGVTRALVLEWTEAVERDVTPAMLLAADEVFLTGTFGAQTPVASIDGRTIGTGEMGAMTERLRGLYKALVAA